MAEQRIKNSKRNIVSGLIKQMANLVLSFAIRTLVIYLLGAEYQGLSGLFSSIMQVLNLTDLGFSTAIMFLLYKPISENDKTKICCIVNFLKKIYFFVGITMFSLGLALMPFLKHLISGDVPPDIDLYLLYLIYLVNTSVSYILFAYKSTLISSMQREDVVSKIYTIIFIFVKICQVVLLVTLRNYYAYIIVIPVGTIINSVAVQIASKKLFPDIVPYGTIQNETKKVFNKQIISVFIGKISDVARNSIDNIVISAFFGLTLVTIYDNYYYIYSSLYGIMGIIIHGIIASVGNSIVSETIEKNYSDLLRINFIFMLIIGWCSICMYCLYQPFMSIWMKGNSQMMMSEMDMTLMCVYFYVINMTYVRSMYLDGKGLFHECRFWCIGEALLNIVLNIVLGKLLGLTGIILATIFTIVAFNFFGRSRVLFKYYFVTGKTRFYLQHLFYLVVTIVAAIITKIVTSFIPDWGFIRLIVILILCCVIPGIVYFLSYFRTKIFTDSLDLVKRIIFKKTKTVS